MRIYSLLSIFLLTAASLSAQVNVKLASDVWPPFTNAATEQAFASSLVREALQRAYVTEETTLVSFQEVLDGINNGTYDGSAALWKTAEREETMLFSQPYLQNQLVLVGRKGADVSASTLNELSGKTIAVVGTYAYGDILKQIPDVNLIAGESDQENLDKLLVEEVDYMLTDRLLIQFLSRYQQKEVAANLSIGESTLLTRALHFVLRKGFPGAKDIMQRFNEAVVKMVADGSYNKILQLNWIQADVDGDGKMEFVLQGNEGGTLAPTSSYSVYFNTTDSSKPASAASRYYIEGKYYENWNQVPAKYKQPVTQSTDGNFNFLNFKIK